MRGKKSVLGLLSLAIPGSFLSTAILLSYGYSSQLVSTIGDTRQLDPLFLGIVVGSLLFSLAGYLARPTWPALSLETLVASLLLAASYAIMVANSLILDGTLILAVSFLITSPLAPVGTLLRLGRRSHSVPERVAFGVAQGALSILFVFVFAFYYETHGQVDFFVGPLVMLILSLVCTIILLPLG